MNTAKGAFWSSFSDTAQDADTSQNTERVLCRDKSVGSVQIVWTGVNAADATFKVQQSNDGTNFVDITSATTTLGAASGSALIPLTAITGEFIRCVYTKGSNTEGSFEYHGIIKHQ